MSPESESRYAGNRSEVWPRPAGTEEEKPPPALDRREQYLTNPTWEVNGTIEFHYPQAKMFYRTNSLDTVIVL